MSSSGDQTEGPVFLDTMILLWWLRREASPGQEEMIERADWLMRELEGAGATPMVSAVSIAELMRRYPIPSQRKAMAVIEETFLIRTFDTKAALLAAEMYGSTEGIDEYESRKRTLKGDQQIVATALASGASVLYSHGRGHPKACEESGADGS